MACADIVPLAGIPACEETGRSFEENAVQKALHYSSHARHLLFADDSGLEVAALNGAPGIHSARYAGASATDQQNNQLLLEKLQGVADRRARFVCVVALADCGRFIRTFRAEVEGQVVQSLRGTNGFGYDPLFYYAPLARTFGELPLERKFPVSHRGKALLAMIDYLAKR